jgi:hypothetical protein
VQTTGVQGLQGTQGETGIQGPAGSGTGIQGETGIQGDTGVQGLTGISGGDGSQGETGVQGVTGPSGGGGGGSVTIVSDGGNVPTSVDGDVILQGTANLTANTEIRGSIYFSSATPKTLYSEGFNLNVHGDVYGNNDGISTTPSTFGSPGNITIFGCVYETQLNASGYHDGMGTGSSGGTITLGAFMSPNMNISAIGGDSGDGVGYGGGTVEIFGSCVCSNINVNGGNDQEVTFAVGGNGGSVTIHGHFSGGSVTAAGGLGDGGGDGNGGNGGTIEFKSNSSFQTINIKGGDGGLAGFASIGGNAGSLICDGFAHAGLGDTPDGVHINAIGGASDPTGGVDGIGGSVTFRGGCDIEQLDVSDGTGGGGGGGSGTNFIKMRGNCSFDTINMTTRTGSTIESIGNTVLTVNVLSDRNILKSQTGISSSAQPSPAGKVYTSPGGGQWKVTNNDGNA